jgi:hypothetical protein
VEVCDRTGGIPPLAKHPLVAALHSVLTKVEPTCFTKAATDPRWKAAMTAELKALISNKTWTLCPRPSQ